MNINEKLCSSHCQHVECEENDDSAGFRNQHKITPGIMLRSSSII